MNPKKKGNKGERDFSKWIRENLNEFCYRNSGSGAGILKSDAHNNLGINFEIKTVKALNLKEAFKQSQRDADMAHTKPYVVVHFDGMPQDSWIMCMDNGDWVELYKKSQQPRTENPDKDLKNKLELLQYKGQDIIRELEKLEIQDKTVLYNIKNFKTLLRETINRIK